MWKWAPFLALMRFFGVYPKPVGKAICANCKWYYEDDQFDHIDHICRLNAEYVLQDSVSGYKQWIKQNNCYKKNPTGLCIDFEPNESEAKRCVKEYLEYEDLT